MDYQKCGSMDVCHIGSVFICHGGLGEAVLVDVGLGAEIVARGGGICSLNWSKYGLSGDGVGSGVGIACTFLDPYLDGCVAARLTWPSGRPDSTGAKGMYPCRLHGAAAGDCKAS